MYNNTKAFGDIDSLDQEELFGENLRPRPANWIGGLAKRCRRKEYPTLDRKAVTLRKTDVRVLPSNKPAFRDPAEAGEGYPFDYLQYSSLWANTPVHVSHAVQDSSWYFVEAAHVFGWVEARDLAFVPDDLAERIRSLSMAALTRDDVSVKDRSSRFRFQGRIGMLLPVVSTDRRSYHCLILVADQNRQAVPKIVRLEHSQAAIYPVEPSPRICAGIAQELMGQPYGWGGLYGNRDCSATVRDYFIPFGIWLPRNSAQQARVGRRIDLETKPDQAKEGIILDRGMPFMTLVTMPGHVMLYIGSHQGRAAVLHTMWGLKTRDFLGREGRLVVGRTVITDLYPGREVFFLERPKGELLHRITGMTRLDRGVRKWEGAPFIRDQLIGSQLVQSK